MTQISDPHSDNRPGENQPGRTGADPTNSAGHHTGERQHGLLETVIDRMLTSPLGTAGVQVMLMLAGLAMRQMNVVSKRVILGIIILGTGLGIGGLVRFRAPVMRRLLVLCTVASLVWGLFLFHWATSDASPSSASSSGYQPSTGLAEDGTGVGNAAADAAVSALPLPTADQPLEERLARWAALLPVDRTSVLEPEAQMENTYVLDWSNRLLNDALNPDSSRWLAAHKGEAWVTLGTLWNAKGILGVQSDSTGRATCDVYLHEEGADGYVDWTGEPGDTERVLHGARVETCTQGTITTDLRFVLYAIPGLARNVWMVGTPTDFSATSGGPTTDASRSDQTSSGDKVKPKRDPTYSLDQSMPTDPDPQTAYKIAQLVEELRNNYFTTGDIGWLNQAYAYVNADYAEDVDVVGRGGTYNPDFASPSGERPVGNLYDLQKAEVVDAKTIAVTLVVVGHDKTVAHRYVWVDGMWRIESTHAT